MLTLQGCTAAIQNGGHATKHEVGIPLGGIIDSHSPASPQVEGRSGFAGEVGNVLRPQHISPSIINVKP